MKQKKKKKSYLIQNLGGIFKTQGESRNLCTRLTCRPAICKQNDADSFCRLKIPLLGNGRFYTISLPFKAFYSHALSKDLVVSFISLTQFVGVRPKMYVNACRATVIPTFHHLCLAAMLWFACISC